MPSAVQWQCSPIEGSQIDSDHETVLDREITHPILPTDMPFFNKKKQLLIGYFFTC